MAFDQVFSQLLPQNQSPGVYSDKPGSSGAAHPAKLKMNRESNGADGESFLSTLKRVSQNADRSNKSARIVRHSQNKAKAPGLEERRDDDSETTVAQSEDMSAPAERLEKDSSEQDGPMTVMPNFIDILKTLESLGGISLDGGSDGKSLLDGDLPDGKKAAALEMLIDRLRQNLPISSADLKSAIERLQQFIAGILEGKHAILNDENAGSRFFKMVQSSDRIYQWLKDLSGGNYQLGVREALKSIPGQAGSASAGLGDIPGPAADAVDLNGKSNAGAPAQPTESAAVASQPASGNAGGPVKGLPEKSAPAAQEFQKLDAPTDDGKSDTGASKTKEAHENWRDAKIAGRMEIAQAAGREGRLPNNAEPIPDGRAAKRSAQAGAKPETGSPANGFGPAAAAEEPASTRIQELQGLKDGHASGSGGVREEAGTKVIKTEVGGNDTGLLNSQNLPLAKPTESGSLPKEPDSDRNALKAQTMDQIVQKAAIHLKNGQHEARIDLKPEYLGHIRMQVTSENHQVTVKILAEHGFVKDMIENNAHQLKADLQQQGLHIDKLEVTVSRDSDDSGSPKERLPGMRARQGAADNGKQGNSGHDLSQEKRQRRRTPRSATMVDYFA